MLRPKIHKRQPNVNRFRWLNRLLITKKILNIFQGYEDMQVYGGEMVPQYKTPDKEAHPDCSTSA